MTEEVDAELDVARQLIVGSREPPGLFEIGVELLLRYVTYPQATFRREVHADFLALLAELKDLPSEAAEASIIAMGHYQEASAYEAVVAVAQSPYPEVREAVAFALPSLVCDEDRLARSVEPLRRPSCSAGPTHRPSTFITVANCLPKAVAAPRECVGGTSVDFVGLRASGRAAQPCATYANLRPWQRSPRPSDRQADLQPGAKVQWRYIVRRRVRGARYAMVHQYEDDSAAAWVFVRRSCLADRLPVHRGGHYYCPELTVHSNRRGLCAKAVKSIILSTH